MDPVSAAIALLAPYLAKAGEAAAAGVGQAAVEGGKAILGALKRKFGRDDDDYARQTLERLEAKPDDAGRQAALRAVVEDKANEDPGFADELRGLVAQTVGDRPVGHFLTQVYGGEVGRIVNIQTAGTVHID